MENNKSLISLSQAVEIIKTAILQGQLEAVKDINRVQLALYFAIGRYLSINTRHFAYGTSALKAISEQLRKELPGLRGFSETQLIDMRRFYEAWKMLDPNFPVATGKLQQKDSAVTTAKSYTTENQIDILFQICYFSTENLTPLLWWNSKQEISSQATWDS